jgi:hypothetical protein
MRREEGGDEEGIMMRRGGGRRHQVCCSCWYFPYGIGVADAVPSDVAFPPPSRLGEQNMVILHGHGHWPGHHGTVVVLSSALSGWTNWELKKRGGG